MLASLTEPIAMLALATASTAVQALGSAGIVPTEALYADLQPTFFQDLDQCIGS